MKKFWMLFCLSLFFAGCKTAAFTSSAEKVELKGNPTTGYTWICTVGDESIIEVEKDVTYLGKDDMVGAPSLFSYTVRSLKQGSTSLKFEYKRPWEDKESQELRFYEVTVKENGKISLTEAGQSPKK